MWAQVITCRLKPVIEGQAKDMIDHLIAAAQPDSDSLLELAMSDQRAPMSVVIPR